MHTWVAVPSLRLTVPHRLLLNLEVRPELTFGWNLQISGSVCETEPDIIILQALHLPASVPQLLPTVHKIENVTTSL